MPWLDAMWDRQGSDLLLATGSQPGSRSTAASRSIEGPPELTGRANRQQIVRGMLGPEQQATFEEKQDVDFSLTYLERARLRGSAYTQRG